MQYKRISRGTHNNNDLLEFNQEVSEYIENGWEIVNSGEYESKDYGITSWVDLIFRGS